MFRFRRRKKRASANKSGIGKSSRRSSVEQLEQRELLTVNMSGAEQLMLELVNRARMDPEGELAFHSGVSNLNQGSPDPAITSTPKQPLAPVQTLIDASILHSQDMIDSDYFSHYSQNGDNPEDRAETAGYPTYSSVSENLNFGSYFEPLDLEAEVIRAHESLFASPGHRTNMMKNHKTESGVGIRVGETTPTEPNPPFNGSQTFDAVLVTQKFGEPALGDDAFITGVVFDDLVVQDDFYNIGEGLGGIQISALNLGTGETYYTSTGPSGGYALAVPDGWYTVMARDFSQEQPLVEVPVVVLGENEKVDFNTIFAVQNSNNIDDLVVTDQSAAYVGENDGYTMLAKTYSAWVPDVINFGEGDINGDGLDDIVGHTADGKIYVGLGTGWSSFAVKQFGTLSSSIAWTDFTIADFDADGKDDILVRADTDGSWWALKSTGNSLTYHHVATFDPIYNWSFVVGDFNSDNRVDIAGRAGSDGSWWVGISDGNAAPTSGWGSWSSSKTWSEYKLGDFDGDGRYDIAGLADGDEWWVSRSTGSSFTTTKWASWSAGVPWQHYTVGDFNGDGRDDIVARAETTGDWWMVVSTGQTFTHQLWANWPTSTNWHDVQMGDLNGDGFDDLIGRADNGEWWILQSIGNSFEGRFGINLGAAVSDSGVGSFSSGGSNLL